MIFLANSLTSPALGTIFWSILIFGLFLAILTKFAWKPILSAVKARDEMIKSSLESAELAREEMHKLQSDNEAILKKAREEREVILREARDVRDKLI
jgi:F-type H+-transporting ATPase subunit b